MNILKFSIGIILLLSTILFIGDFLSDFKDISSPPIPELQSLPPEHIVSKRYHYIKSPTNSQTKS